MKIWRQKKHKTSLSAGLSILPARLTTRWLAPALTEETNRLLKIHRAHALALVATAVKRTVDKWSAEVNAAASEIESRVISAITGEQSASLTWRQTSSPLASANWGGAELVSIRAKLVEIRERVPFDRVSAEKEVPEEESPAAEPATQIAGKPFQAAQVKETDLATDLRTRGCAVCDHVVKMAYDFFVQWQYAIASDEKAQSSFATEQGFCSLHNWQLHALSSPVGESIGLARFTEHVSRLLAKLERGPAAASNVHKILRTSESCRVCCLLNEAEAAYIARFGDFLDDAGGRQIYGGSQGICLRHLACLLATITSADIREFLLATASRRFEETAEDMQSFAIKRDALRRNLTNANEDDAYLRALIHLAGAKDYSTPWPEDREI